MANETLGNSRIHTVIVNIPFNGSGSEQLSALSSKKNLTKYFQQEIIADCNEGVWTTQCYIMPRRPLKPLIGTNGKLNYNTITESPVVYIITFKQDSKMIDECWLGHLLEGSKYSPRSQNYNPYRSSYVAYVGETNNIIQRTDQHLLPSNGSAANTSDDGNMDGSYSESMKDLKKADHVLQAAIAKGVEVWQYIIWNTYFTKSMTLDLEDRFIDYLHAVNGVYPLNGRGNPQDNYYKCEEKNLICSGVWRQLSLHDRNLFPPEADIWNSELYKISPFHSLSQGQQAAVDEICDASIRVLHEQETIDSSSTSVTSPHRLIMVEGASGTGKSIVLSTLFVKLSQSLLSDQEEQSDYYVHPNNKVCLIVNQNSQLYMYKNLARKIGLLPSTKDDVQCVYRPTPFLNAVDSGRREQPDVVLVDEAHLLLMEKEARNYGVSCKWDAEGTSLGFHGNQLYDILLRAKVVVAVFDPVQIMRQSQQWDENVISSVMFSSDDDMDGHLHEVGPIELHNNGNTTPGCDTFLTYRVGLSDQFRIDAGQEIIDWIDRLTDTTAVGIDKIPADSMNRKRPHGIHGADAYDLRIYRSPIDLAAAIRQRRIEMRKHAEEARGKKHSPSSAQVAAPLCRMLATFDWAYDPVNKSGDVVLYKMI